MSHFISAVARIGCYALLPILILACDDDPAEPSANCDGGDVIVGGGTASSLDPSDPTLATMTCIQNLNVIAGPVEFTALTRVEEALRVSATTGDVTFPVLEFIGDGALFEHSGQALLDLTSLEEVHGGMAIRGMDLMTRLDLAGATVSGGLVIDNNPLLNDIDDVSCGLTVTGGFAITDNPSLATADAQALADCITADSKEVSGNGP